MLGPLPTIPEIPGFAGSSTALSGGPNDARLSAPKFFNVGNKGPSIATLAIVAVATLFAIRMLRGNQ